MLNNLKYLPELIVINVGASNFTRFSTSEQRANIRKMVAPCKALTKKVFRPTDNFRGLFLNLMISLPWYVGWKSQRVACRARSHLNGCLASIARDRGCYIVHHDGIVATIRKGLYDQNSLGDLSDVGISMFLADIIILIKNVCKLFQVVQEARSMSLHMAKMLHHQSLRQAVQALRLITSSHWEYGINPGVRPVSIKFFSFSVPN